MHSHVRRPLASAVIIAVILGTLINLSPTWLHDVTAEGLGEPPILEYAIYGPYLPQGFFSVERGFIHKQLKDSLLYEFTMLQGTSANITFTMARVEYISKKPINVRLTMTNYEVGRSEKPPEPEGLTVTFTPIPVPPLEEGSRINVTAILTVSKDAPDGLYTMIVHATSESEVTGGADFMLRIGSDHPKRDIAVSFSYADKKDMTEPPSMIALHPGETAPLHMMITSLLNETRREKIDVDIRVVDEKTWNVPEIQGLKFPVEIGKVLLEPGEGTEALLKVETDLDAEPGVYPVLILINSTYYQLAKPVKIALVQDIKVEHTTTTTTTEAEAQSLIFNQYLIPLVIAIATAPVIYLIVRRRRTPIP